MIRKQLLAMPEHKAPALFMEMARTDEKKWVVGYANENKMYSRTTYVLAGQYDGILKISFFFTEALRSGEDSPAFDVYLDKENDQYLTWDAEDSRWRESTVRNLRYPTECWLWKYFQGLPEYGTVWADPESQELIEDYIGDELDDLRGVQRWQSGILERKRKKKDKKLTDAWDADMALVPETPEGFKDFADKEGIAENYIFYLAGNKTKEGFCTYCRDKVPVIKPKYNSKRKCPVCGKDVTLKSTGKLWTIQTGRYHVHLIQPMDEGFVLRTFMATRKHKNLIFWKWDSLLWEVRRVLYCKGKPPRAYRMGDFKGTYRWIPDTALSEGFYMNYWRGPLMIDGDMDNPEITKTGLIEMAASGIRFDPEGYLVSLKIRNCLEQTVKAGLPRLAVSIMDGSYKPGKLRKGSLAKALGLDNARMGRLRKHNGDIYLRSWLEYEKRMNTVYEDEVLLFFADQKIFPDHLQFILDKMSPVKIRNYLDKQSMLSRQTPSALVGTWRDYLDMARRLKMNISLEIFYKPKNLRKAHDECVKAGGEAEVNRRVNEIRKKFPHIEKILGSIQKKYSFTDKKYSIVVPDKIVDIIFEGRALGHCLDRSDIYFDRIERQESYIVFLRKTEDIDTPYYTLEIEPGGTTRQKRTTGDKQDKDFNEALSFIRKWQKAIQKNLGKEDLQFAEDSARLRVEEFIQLRKEKAKIWHGPMAGKLLADVLEADLMEAAL